MSEKFNASLTRVIQLESKVSQQKKIIFWLGLILGLMWLLKIARIILGFVKPAINKIIPLWLDILI
jgi:hypothetical protein